MDKQQAKQRIEKLKKEVSHHRYLYHVLDKQEISDAALDSLKDELQKLEEQYPDLVTSDSPTQRVGGKPLQKFSKVKHTSRMISLYDAFSAEEMKSWQERLEKILIEANCLEKLNYYCEIKLDGLAASAIYKKGFFERGATRGDGKVGEDVSQNLKTIESLPLKLRQPKESELNSFFSINDSKEILDILKNKQIEVRGEVLITKQNFEKLNQKLKEQKKAVLANPRNAAAGSIRQLDSKIAADRKLIFFAYEIIIDKEIAEQQLKNKLLNLLGFKVVSGNKFCSDLEEVFYFHNYWQDQKEKLDFECDGVVVKVNNTKLWPILGHVGKGPRFMMAFKFPAIQSTTRIKDVVWQVGRTGILTPTAILEPVKIGGVTVSRASLHNFDEIQRLNAKIGDTAIVERAGDVIPKIIKVLPKLRNGQEKNITVPKICPNCGGSVVKNKNEVAFRCLNEDCYAINLRKLSHWASRGATNIDGLGHKIIAQLLQEGLVKDPADFYELEVGDLKPLERFADKSAVNLIQAIKNSRQLDPARLLFALSIRHIGEESANLLINKFPEADKNLKNFKKVFKNLSKEELEEIKDIGPKVAESVFGWFHNKKNLNLLDKLQDSGVEIKRKVVYKNSLAGLNFVLTGTLPSLTREEGKAKIRELGGQINSSISRKTDYLIAGDDPGSKLIKAKKMGVKILNEEEFLHFLNN